MKIAKRVLEKRIRALMVDDMHFGFVPEEGKQMLCL